MEPLCVELWGSWMVFLICLWPEASRLDAGLGPLTPPILKGQCWPRPWECLCSITSCAPNGAACTSVHLSPAWDPPGRRCSPPGPQAPSFCQLSGGAACLMGGRPPRGASAQRPCHACGGAALGMARGRAGALSPTVAQGRPCGGPGGQPRGAWKRGVAWPP